MATKASDEFDKAFIVLIRVEARDLQSPASLPAYELTSSLWRIIYAFLSLSSLKGNAYLMCHYRMILPVQSMIDLMTISLTSFI